MLRLAFAGFRHIHVRDFYGKAQAHSDVEVVAAAEDDPDAAAEARRAGVALTHPSIRALVDDAGAFDAAVIGDVFGRRGDLAARVLELDRHVIADKPVCTRLEELERIEAEATRRGLAVGCLLDLREHAAFRTLKEEIRAGTIGRVHSVVFLGQHPLRHESRPAWYWEPESHGGTINDIAIHALDALPWMLGESVAEVVAARTWNDRLSAAPAFEVGAQLMLRMAGGAGVLGDVSYLAPDGQGYTVPQYWRFTVCGELGMLEAAWTEERVLLWAGDETNGRTVNPVPARPLGCLEDFLAEIRGRPNTEELTTAAVLRSARAALLAQRAAGTRQPVRL